MNDEQLLQEFKADQDSAFLSLDEQQIRRFFKKYNDGKDLPRDMTLFWAAVHKAITGNTRLPIEFRRQSKAWLNERDLQSFDDGDL